MTTMTSTDALLERYARYRDVGRRLHGVLMPRVPRHLLFDAADRLGGGPGRLPPDVELDFAEIITGTLLDAGAAERIGFVQA